MYRLSFYMLFVFASCLTLLVISSGGIPIEQLLVVGLASYIYFSKQAHTSKFLVFLLLIFSIATIYEAVIGYWISIPVVAYVSIVVYLTFPILGVYRLYQKSKGQK